MKKIFDGVYVDDGEETRTYLIDAEFSEHIHSLKSRESARQEIQLRKNAPEKKIFDLIDSNDFNAEIDDKGLIHVKTDDPVRLVKVLCDQELIDVGQATAIIAHEIEHIKNPLMQKMVRGQKRLKEIREVVIRYQLVLSQSAMKALELKDTRPDKDKTRS